MIRTVKLRRGMEWASFRLLGIGTITLVLFTFAEIGARWYESETRGDMKIIARAESGKYKADSIPPGDYQLFPYLMERIIPSIKNSDGSTRTNAFGLRGDEFELPKPAGVKRIVVIGGSAVWGVGTDDYHRTFCGVMASEFNAGKHGGRIEIINAGQPAFNSTQQLIFLEQELLDYDPDFVIIYGGFNDLYFSMRHSESARPGRVYWQWPPYFEDIKEDMLLSPRRRLAPLRRLLSLSRFLVLMKGLVEHESESHPTKNEMREAALNNIERYRKNLTIARYMLEHRGVPAAIVTGPICGLRKNPSRREKKIIDNWAETERLKLAVELYPQMVESARMAAGESGTHFWDISGIFEGLNYNKVTLFVDIVNYNNEGNAIVGEKLAELVAAQILER